MRTLLKTSYASFAVIVLFIATATSAIAAETASVNAYLEFQTKERSERTLSTPSEMSSLHALLDMADSVQKRPLLSPPVSATERKFIETSAKVGGLRAQLDVVEARARKSFDRGQAKTRAREIWILEDQKYREPSATTFKLIHIALGTGPDWAKAEERVQKTRSGLAGNVDFEELARQYSDERQRQVITYTVDESQVEPHVWVILRKLKTGETAGPIAIAGAIIFAQGVSQQLGEKRNFESVEQIIIDGLERDAALKAREAATAAQSQRLTKKAK